MPNIVAVCAMYHLEEMNKMLKIATSQAEDLGYNLVDVIEVPGCMEIPLALDRVLANEESMEHFALVSLKKARRITVLSWVKASSKPSWNCSWFTTNQSVWASLVLVHYPNTLDLELGLMQQLQSMHYAVVPR